MRECVCMSVRVCVCVRAIIYKYKYLPGYYKRMKLVKVATGSGEAEAVPQTW